MLQWSLEERAEAFAVAAQAPELQKDEQFIAAKRLADELAAGHPNPRREGEAPQPEQDRRVAARAERGGARQGHLPAPAEQRPPAAPKAQGRQQPQGKGQQRGEWRGAGWQEWRGNAWHREDAWSRGRG